jgi:hypothetical protein
MWSFPNCHPRPIVQRGKRVESNCIPPYLRDGILPSWCGRDAQASSWGQEKSSSTNRGFRSSGTRRARKGAFGCEKPMIWRLGNIDAAPVGCHVGGRRCGRESLVEDRDERWRFPSKSSNLRIRSWRQLHPPLLYIFGLGWRIGLGGLSRSHVTRHIFLATVMPPLPCELRESDLLLFSC